MPIGIFVDSAATLVGAFIGSLLGQRLPRRFADTLSYVFSVAPIVIGITMIISYTQLSVVILSLILGAAIGELLKLNQRVHQLSDRLTEHFSRGSASDKLNTAVFVNIIVMFSISGYGIFGALNEGFLGDHSSLIVKAILDFFTVLCFTSLYGRVMLCTWIPQFSVYLLLFFLSSLVMPVITPEILGDLSACAGVITMSTGINLLFKKDIPTISMLPSLVVVILLSRIWGVLF